MPTGGARARVNADRDVLLDHPDALLGSKDLGLFADLEPALFLVDGGNLLWRAAHGRPAPFTAADGRDVTPVFRFFTLLRRAMGTHGLFSECVVCFDGPRAWTARVAVDPAYKANRDYDLRDVEFMEWLPEIRAALDACGVASIEVDDLEADDVIATLVADAGARRSRILSTDRDYLQLVSGRVTVANPRHRPALVDVASVRARFGVEPCQWVDYRALTGDPSDGIAGVTGYGPVRAASVLADGRTLDGLRANGDLPADVADAWADVCRWRTLIRLRTDAPVGHAPSGEPTPKLPPAGSVCRELGLG